MTERDLSRGETDPPRRKPGGRTGPCDPARVAENVAADALQTDAESSYGAASADARLRQAEPGAGNGTMQPAIRFEVEDGDVLATVEPQLSDAAADVLWRVIEKATRGGKGR